LLAGKEQEEIGDLAAFVERAAALVESRVRSTSHQRESLRLSIKVTQIRQM
jgi:hypothetical protein